ncbi:alpha/beta hydrolase-fold protein [Dyella sp. ASV21]|uniref:alpha/beta hydrolase-fold protein n=1 Tax=Dyella sp. ASV21 TaxID=2795114 RepID=UPI0018EC561D|nr:alpha/beta hydrolase-fold protein [Dyella sp. ASV21]
MSSQRLKLAVLCCFGAAALAGCSSQEAAAPTRFYVELARSASAPSSGRLLVFAEPAAKAEAAHKDGTVSEVDADPLAPSAVSVAGRDVSRIEPGHAVDLDADMAAFPVAFSQLPPGDYYVQAVLDTHHSYNYSGRGAGDVLSTVIRMHLPASNTPVLTLSQVLPTEDAWQLPPSAPQATRDALPQARQHTTDLDFVSPVLSAFWGRPIHMRGFVLTPPGYDPKGRDTYPVVYQTHGFGGGLHHFAGGIANTWLAMSKGDMPPMIWVYLDESSATGTHEFADSVNNGPWGQALTEELIPSLESGYRMDATASGRFLNGHSSGGWATLWLQTRYPKVFGGTWSTSPDPSDFHDFVGVDLYAANANVYRKSDGSAYPLVRDKGKVLASLEEFARQERVLGSYGGQMASFDWVFSPRGEDGQPQPMFDRDTGKVDPAVVTYWRDHYDIAQRLRTNWPALKPDLDGKIHLIVGTADTFYLDGAAHRLKATLDDLHAQSDVRFLPGKTHFDLYASGGDRTALLKQIAWEMYGVARPQSALKPRVAAP